MLKINGLINLIKGWVWILFLFFPLQSAASTGLDSGPDTLSLRFRLDSTTIDLSYADNLQNLNEFLDRFHRSFDGRNSAGIQFDVYAGASPEGSENHNIQLGAGRGAAIASLLKEQLGEQAGTIVTHNLGPRWDDFYDIIAGSDEPWRDEVLRIIRSSTKADPRWLDPREMKLRSLRNGTVWPILLKKYLPPLRSGGTAVVSWHPERDTVYTYTRDTVVVAVRDTVVIIHENYYTPEPPAPRVRQKADQTPAWALKTNFLLWGVVAPNLQAEFPLGHRNRWSLELETFTPWFIWNRNAQASQFIDVGAEIRLWLGDRQYHRWLDGWHIGLAAAGGYYDWEWMKSDGYQGEFVNAYVNLGWQHRFGKHWAIDLGFGIGAMGTQYRHYYGGSVYPEGREEEWDQHLIWHDTGYLLWPGPCHAAVSLVYMFNYRQNKDSRR